MTTSQRQPFQHCPLPLKRKRQTIVDISNLTNLLRLLALVLLLF
uniref:Uncharacterized protein n=1 Tax=Ciona intestinalis TaxID=7719 RepID=H2Y3M1_CIOIN